MFINPIGEYWFLHTLLLLSLIDFVANKKNIRLDVQVILWFALLVLVNYIPGKIPFFWDSVFSRILRFGLYFTIGKVVYVLGVERICSNSKIVGGLSIIAVLAWLGWFYFDGVRGLAVPKMILAATTTLLLVVVLKKSGYSLLSNLGKDSLNIYLLHPYFIVACKILLSRLIDNSGVYFVVSTVISIGLCYVAMIVISKIKCLDFVFRPTYYMSYFAKK